MAVLKRENPDGTISLFPVCDTCGKPIVKSDEYGMFCEDECKREESIRCSRILDAILNCLGLDQ